MDTSDSPEDGLEGSPKLPIDPATEIEMRDRLDTIAKETMFPTKRATPDLIAEVFSELTRAHDALIKWAMSKEARKHPNPLAINVDVVIDKHRDAQKRPPLLHRIIPGLRHRIPLRTERLACWYSGTTRLTYRHDQEIQLFLNFGIDADVYVRIGGKKGDPVFALDEKLLMDCSQRDIERLIDDIKRAVVQAADLEYS